MQDHPTRFIGRLAPVAIGASLMVAGAIFAAADRPPSLFGVDAPELAPLGAYSVGVRTLHLVQHAQVDVSAFDAVRGTAPERDRALNVDLWYPARTGARAKRETYTAVLPGEPPAGPVRFSVAGIAVRDARPAGSGYPLVVVSHGYSNAPAAMTWLTENLASKGYVVAAIRHDDPPITDTAGFPQLLLRRPLDIAFVTKTLQSMLEAEHLVDPARTALVGYSMGGYGVLTAAGALLDPGGNAAKLVPGGLLLPYAAGGTLRETVVVNGLRAVVAISPAGGGTLGAWNADGLRMIKAPLLLISGSQDPMVDYKTGARAFFDAATNSHRYLLTFVDAGHAIGLNPAPRAMRRHLWDQDWFEDAVWSKQRINAINAHFMTAFLDLYLKGDDSRAAYLDVSVPDSAAGVWPAASASAYAAFSPGTPDVTVWKGFQRNHSAGLELLQAPASGP
ncbi:MAG: alpha/beta hydrolase family protein [Steroidobacteraceae bacterium]|jgi:predicted dienelactone hydrolase